MFKVGSVVTIKDSLDIYGMDFGDQTGMIMKIYQDGNGRFKTPCARICFKEVVLRFTKGGRHQKEIFFPLIRLEHLEIA